MKTNEFGNRRVTVMGLGRFGGGIGVTRWLARQGARVTVTDLKPADQLKDALAELEGLDFKTRLGGHDVADFRDTDLLVVNPAVRPDHELIRAARDAGVPITTEINLFLERCPARVIGITGSVGKSTVTAMIAAMLKSAGIPSMAGGNLGGSLLDCLQEITPDHVIALELSSFQLHYTPLIRWSPRVAVLTNISPNHLDWHGVFAAYAADKLNIVRFQDAERDTAVIPDEGPLREQISLLHGDLSGVWRFSVSDRRPMARLQSTPAVDCDDRRASWGVTLRTPGAHNLLNAAAALTAVHALGVDTEPAVTALADFTGLEHRLQLVATVDGVTYFNDSKSSTPAAAMTAIRAMSAPTRVILGGYDKGVDLRELAEFAAKNCAFVACIGATGPAIVDAVRAVGGNAAMFDSLEAAVTACRAAAQNGDAVLLSPGCASWGMFSDFRERGERFCAIVRQRA
ncbi:MAG: UDP-N-acetylmuramoyl-L-alanine--D-glutamate ligase [Phycisphaerales bacterium]|nr:UDP-N-acetylmuramoyl-L-alanine--D-glutamate ligase [Phycisphaerales bacterium]